MEIRSVWVYEFKSVLTDNVTLRGDSGLDENESELLESKIAAAIIIIKATPPNPKINFGFFKPGLRETCDCKV